MYNLSWWFLINAMLTYNNSLFVISISWRIPSFTCLTLLRSLAYGDQVVNTYNVTKVPYHLLLQRKNLQQITNICLFKYIWCYLLITKIWILLRNQHFNKYTAIYQITIKILCAIMIPTSKVKTMLQSIRY